MRKPYKWRRIKDLTTVILFHDSLSDRYALMASGTTVPGTTPDETKEGVLWVEPTRPALFEWTGVFGAEQTVTFPVDHTNANVPYKSVLLSGEAALWLADRFGMAVVSPFGTFKVTKMDDVARGSFLPTRGPKP